MNRIEQTNELEILGDKCAEAIGRGDHQGAIFLMKSLVNKGYWNFLAVIGEMYETGGGNLESNPEEAINWYRKSLFECDDPKAHLGMGRAYYFGKGCIEKDFDKAFFHFQKAYIAKHPEGGLYLGIMAFNGSLGERDIGKAREYFQIAVENEYCLAFLYLAGIESSSRHYIRAFKYANKARKLIDGLKNTEPDDRRLMGIDIKSGKILKI